MRFHITFIWPDRRHTYANVAYSNVREPRYALEEFVKVHRHTKPPFKAFVLPLDADGKPRQMGDGRLFSVEPPTVPVAEITELH